MSILVVGTIAFDHVKTPFAERTNLLAGAATYFSIAASFFTKVSVVGIVGEDFTDEHERIFDARGIDLSGVERRKDGKSFRWTGEYGYDFNTRTTLDTQLNVFADFQPRISPGPPGDSLPVSRQRPPGAATGRVAAEPRASDGDGYDGFLDQAHLTNYVKRSSVLTC